jgi:NAD(P) transhydrogenase subunit alpha
MKIGIAKERRAHELRVAVTPDTVKKFIGLGAEVAIETGAGLGSSYTDEAYAAAGAKVVPDEAAAA